MVADRIVDSVNGAMGGVGGMRTTCGTRARWRGGREWTRSRCRRGGGHHGTVDEHRGRGSRLCMQDLRRAAVLSARVASCRIVSPRVASCHVEACASSFASSAISTPLLAPAALHVFCTTYPIIYASPLPCSSTASTHSPGQRQAIAWRGLQRSCGRRIA